MPRMDDDFYNRYMLKQSSPVPTPYVGEEETAATEKEMAKYLPMSARLARALASYDPTWQDAAYGTGALALRGIGQSPKSIDTPLAVTLAAMLLPASRGPVTKGVAAYSAASKADKLRRAALLSKINATQNALKNMQYVPRGGATAGVLKSRSASDELLNAMWEMARKSHVGQRLP